MAAVSGGVVHCIVYCRNLKCDWEFQDDDWRHGKTVQLSQVRAAQHTNETGHETCVETGYAQIYKPGANDLFGMEVSYPLEDEVVKAEEELKKDCKK